MLFTDIPFYRLINQQLIGSKFKKPEDVVGYLGAVQSQDFFGAKWALGLRLPGSTDLEIEKAFNEGRILRTHALRPTWHFVLPEDLRWIMELNAPQVKKIMSYYNRKLDLTETIFENTNSIIAKSLKGKNFLTRSELSKELSENGFKVSGQKLGHIVGWAELDNIICSGPKKGKQFTYALVSERTPEVKKIFRDEALSKLAQIFFKSRGPATIKDFSKWSGLSMMDSKKGLRLTKSKFETEKIEGKEYYFSPNLSPATSPLSPALLLPNYDEYISSYADFSMISTPETRKNLDKIGNAVFWNHIIINGMIAGSWRRIFNSKNITIEFIFLKTLTKQEKQTLEKEAEKLGKFYNLKIILK
jgi:hypothetical protein